MKKEDGDKSPSASSSASGLRTSLYPPLRKPTSEETRLQIETDKLKQQISVLQQVQNNKDPPRPTFKLSCKSELDDWKKKCFRYFQRHSKAYPEDKVVYALEQTINIDTLASDLLDEDFTGGLYDCNSPVTGTKRTGLLDW